MVQVHVAIVWIYDEFFWAAEDSKEQQRKEIMKLKRRFLKDRKMTSAFFAKTQTRQKIMREVIQTPSL